MKLLESKEANHIEFCRIKNIVDEILQMSGSSELSSILQMLLDPTWLATGLKIECDNLVCECMSSNVVHSGQCHKFYCIYNREIICRNVFLFYVIMFLLDSQMP